MASRGPNGSPALSVKGFPTLRDVTLQHLVLLDADNVRLSRLQMRDQRSPSRDVGCFHYNGVGSGKKGPSGAACRIGPLPPCSRKVGGDELGPLAFARLVAASRLPRRSYTSAATPKDDPPKPQEALLAAPRPPPSSFYTSCWLPFSLVVYRIWPRPSCSL